MTMGYDTESWNWETGEAERWISNNHDLYAACQGLNARGIREEFVRIAPEALTSRDLDYVDWEELSDFFGDDS